jgi:putative molybdopterin biosynthesis protein
VAKNNPKGIHGFEDMIRPDVSIVNRNPGSGTRIFLDMKLASLARDNDTTIDKIVKRIQGYSYESKSHSSVAVAVLQGKADVGLAIRAVAETYGLGFLPVANEEYDFLIRKDRLTKPSVQSFLEVLRSEEFNKELPTKAIGLHPSKDTGEILYDHH